MTITSKYRLIAILAMLLVVSANENQVNEKDLLDTFEVLDFNDDGSLSYREIRGATKQLGQKMSTKELRAFFSVADKNGDRKISKEELAGVLASYTHGSEEGSL